MLWPNIQNFSLVEPIYSEFNNTEVLFRQKRLTSSENILTSVVQRLDDISNLFDGERISFPLQVDGENVVANANQLMIILNGVVQSPNTSFEVQNDSIVFSQPPQPPASVKYVNIGISQISTVTMSFVANSTSGIFPQVGNTLVGVSSTDFTYAGSQGADYVHYLWSAREAYSAFGSYTGNGSDDGPFIYTGFRPAFLLLKSTTLGNGWMLMDSTTGPINPITNWFNPNETTGEQTAASPAVDVDFLSNGFKIRNIDNAVNQTGQTYVYATFAENPFSSPTTAR